MRVRMVSAGMRVWLSRDPLGTVGTLDECLALAASSFSARHPLRRDTSGASVRRVDGPEPSMFTTRNPTTEAVLAQYERLDAAELDRALERATAGQRHWSAVPLDQRALAVGRLGALLRSQRQALAAQMTAEMGKPIAEAIAEIEKSAAACEFFAQHGPGMLADDPVATDAARSWIAYQPLGVLLLVMPWNFPVWQVIRQAAPALLLGNGVLLKHAPNVWGTAASLAQIFEDAGLGSAGFAHLRLDVDQTLALIADARIAGVALTGSERAGRAVGAAAGAAIKPSVLELGGSDPAVVLADADLDVAVPAIVLGRFLNSGQSCIAAKRIIVERAIADRFVSRFIEAVSALRVGDPALASTQVGPLARLDLLEQLEAQLQRSLACGATLAFGGRSRASAGYFMQPTVLTDVTPGMPAFDEETFGPLAAITVATDAAHAIELANHTRFGLGASLYTSRDPGGLIGQLRAGSVMVNGLVKSDARLPFGGVGASGYGRELGRAGLLAFANVKTVWVR